ncbi:MAG: CPBP family intramembrane metalloprotease [Erysipelothrix sp.]|jgi:membrane protease YdiL (CAAX protease family)|nr:CPBP family intramembrane metalloprotease [Erysipelothrix sp.]
MKFRNEFELSLPFNWRQPVFALLFYVIGYLFLIPELTGLAIVLGFIAEADVYLFNGILIGIQLVFTVFIMSSLANENVEKWTWSIRFKEILKFVFFIYIALIAINGLISQFTAQSTSDNQLLIMEVFKEAPLYIIFVAVIFAPIVEEILFRGIIYRTLRFHKFKYIALIVSSFLFGVLHVYESILVGRYEDLWFILVYMAIGWFMSVIYEKSGDILAPIALHMVYNAIAVLTLFLI